METLIQAFKMYRYSLPSHAFFHSGERGPLIFMTDNCVEERDALNIVWPSAALLLCTFHILQQVWRWLGETKHGVHVDERAALMKKFKDLVYAETVTDYGNVYRQVLRSNCVKKAVSELVSF